MKWCSRPSRDVVWTQLAEQLGGEYVRGGFLKTRRAVHVPHGPWTITLDVVSGNNSEHPTTRFRAPFVHRDAIRFTIYRKSFLSGLGKRLGMQDIEIGDPQFDDAFIIQGTDEARVKTLLADRDLRRAMLDQPELSLTIKDKGGWSEPRFAPDEDELYYQAPRVIDDLERLKSLFDLMGLTLERLARVGFATTKPPTVRL